MMNTDGKPLSRSPGQRMHLPISCVCGWVRVCALETDNIYICVCLIVCIQLQLFDTFVRVYEREEKEMTLMYMYLIM